MIKNRGEPLCGKARGDPSMMFMTRGDPKARQLQTKQSSNYRLIVCHLTD